MQSVLAMILSYLIGAIPFGYFTGWAVLRDDIRNHGSGNIGATNVARVIGGKWGALVLLLDALKGGLPALLLPRLFLGESASGVGQLAVGCGIAAIIGHMFPVYLKFRGGKGVATALGVVAVLNWQAAVAAMIVFGITLWLTRYVSLGSVLASMTYCATYLALTGSAAFESNNLAATLFSILVPALIIVRHRANIGRLMRGEESRFGKSSAQKPVSR